jgi:hypothetical protein
MVATTTTPRHTAGTRPTALTINCHYADDVTAHCRYTPKGWLGQLLGSNTWYDFYGDAIATDAAFDTAMADLCTTALGRPDDRCAWPQSPRSTPNKMGDGNDGHHHNGRRSPMSLGGGESPAIAHLLSTSAATIARALSESQARIATLQAELKICEQTSSERYAQAAQYGLSSSPSPPLSLSPPPPSLSLPPPSLLSIFLTNQLAGVSGMHKLHSMVLVVG